MRLDPTSSETFNTEKKTIRIPINGISRQGIYVAKELLYDWGKPSLPDDWEWQWKVNGKGEYVGTFPKRVAKYFYQQHKTKLSAEQLGVLGSKVAEHCERNALYEFDFTQCFDWDAGDFGDDGSCFWSCRTGAKEMLRENGAFAVRFYDSEDKGYARAWVVPINGNVVVFNGYGLESLQIARILSQNWGAYYKKTELSNNGSACGVLWINGRTGYVIGSQEDIDELGPLELGFTEMNNCRCENCGSSIDEGESYTANEETYCECCHDDLFFYCDDCDEDRHNDDYNEINSRAVCDSCLSDNYTVCDDCNEYTHDNDITRGPDDKHRCEDCHLEATQYCEACSSDRLADDFQEGPDGERRCWDCHESVVHACAECGDDHMKEDLHEGPDSKDRCSDCHSDLVKGCAECGDDFLLADMSIGPDVQLRCADCHEIIEETTATC